MKTVIIVGTLLCCTSLCAQSAELSEVQKEKYLRVCEAVQQNSRIKLHVALRDLGTNMKQAEKNIQCNGQSPMTFAATSNSSVVSQYIARRMPEPSEGMMAQVEDDK